MAGTEAGHDGLGCDANSKQANFSYWGAATDPQNSVDGKALWIASVRSNDG
jgi:hypothetical protein